MPKLRVIARHTIKPGHEDDVLALLAEFIGAARAEPGNLAFDAYLKLGDLRSYVLLERYASREAFADHRETPHFKDLLLGRIVPRLEQRVIETYDTAE
jgi:quinol monooxygenase YgiN